MRTIAVTLVCWAVCTLTLTGQSQQVAGIDAPHIAMIEAELPQSPAGFGPPCSDRAAWSAMSPLLQDQLRDAERLAATPVPDWNEDDYLDFSRTGERPRGEKMLHARQDRLAPLVLAECSEGKGRFLQAIGATLDGLAEQPTWTLPAHDPDLSSLHRKRYRVELNSAVLAYEIAEALYLLGDEIPADTRQGIQAALNQRIFEPARAIYRGERQEFWLRGASNWNAVCPDGVTGAALSILPSRADRAFFAAGAEVYSPNYLLSFSPDGYSEEGIGYWAYGFMHYALLRETLWHATAGKLDLFDDPRVASIALFGRSFQMLSRVMADFGDARFGLTPNDGLIAYVDRVYGLQATADAQKYPPSLGNSLVAKVYELFPNHSVRTDRLSAGTTEDPLRHFFAAAGVLVSRPLPGTDGIAITIKAGGNGGHSHNDIGSFSIGLGTEQVIGDPGGPMAYNASTFTERRFQSKLLNSYGHPVPTVGGSLQRDATQVKPKMLETSFTPESDIWALDMTSAYRWPTLLRLTRTVTHSRNARGTIVLEDTFTLSGPTEIEESLPTHGTFTRIDAKTLLFKQGAEAVRVTLDAPGELDVHDEEINEYGNPFHRVGVTVHMKASGMVRITFKPAD